MSVSNLRSVLRRIALGAVPALAAAMIVAAPAKADGRDWDRDGRGWYGNGWEHHHHHRHYPPPGWYVAPPPRVYYAPPPVVYAPPPPPVYYAPAPPVAALNFVFPIR